MNNTMKALRNVVKTSLDNIDAGNSNISEESAILLIEHLSHINQGITTVSKAYACEHVLHINPNKFKYLLDKGIIPEGRKRLGFNELSWTIKDFDRAKEYLLKE